MKLTGPMMSMSASGSIGGVLTFATNKGRAYARTLVKPSNPKSNLQNAVRAMFTFLSQIWKTIDPGDQASWQALADQTKISPFNAFVKSNQNSVKTGHYPQANAVASGSAVSGTIDSLGTVGTQRQVALQTNVTGGTNGWGVIVYRTGPHDASGGTAPAGINSEIAVVMPSEDGLVFPIDTKVVPGKWYVYNFRMFGENNTITGMASTALDVQVQP